MSRGPTTRKSAGLPPQHNFRRRSALVDNTVAPLVNINIGNKANELKIERGIKKSIAAGEISNIYEKFSLRGVMRSFHHWKSLMNQERIVEEFETHGGIRSHQEVYVHNVLLKATRNFFRFYSRKLTDSFYRWKYSITNTKQIENQHEMDRKLKQLKKAIEDKQKKLYNTRKELEAKHNESNTVRTRLEYDNISLRMACAFKNLDKLVYKRKVKAFNNIKFYSQNTKQLQSYSMQMKHNERSERIRGMLMSALKTAFK
jgi:hypothetical protein